MPKNDQGQQGQAGAGGGTAAGTQTAGGESQGQTQKTFTQDELNAQIGERLARERTKYADYDALKTKAAEFDKAAQAQLSETEKLKALLAAEQAGRRDADTRRVQSLMQVAVMTKAASLGFMNPEDAWLLIDTAALKVEDDGKVSGVDDALKALVTARAYLVKAVAAPNLNSGAGGGQGAAPPRLTPDELAAAQALGMTPETYAAMKTVKTSTDYLKLKKPITGGTK